MDRKKIYILGALFFTLIVLVVVFSQGDNKRNFDWNKNYKTNSNQPYGMSVIRNAVGDYYKNGVESLTSTLKEKLPLTAENTNYVFIGSGTYWEADDIKHLTKYVENGNDAFISSEFISPDLMYYLYPTPCEYTNDWRDFQVGSGIQTEVNFLHEDLHKEGGYQFKYINRFQPRNTPWFYWDNLHLCEYNSEQEESEIVPIGSAEIRFLNNQAVNETVTNFVKIPYGNGNFYIHTMPLLFSNYYMINDTGQAYISKVLSHMDEGKVYWDEYNKIDRRMARELADIPPIANDLDRNGPLDYILAQPPLAWAWYLLVGLGILYIIFRAKRKQKAIPVIDPNSNNSLAYINTIGRLYFQQKNHKKIASHKARHFFHYVRNRYHISTKKLDDKFVDKLAEVSSIDREAVARIIYQHELIQKQGNVSESYLNNFYVSVEAFYKNCK